MNIGIIGSGDVGTTLARGFAGKGHTVVLGTRHPDDHRALEPQVRIGSFADAAEHGDAVVLAVRWSGVDAALDAAGPERLRGKVVIDASNPLTYVDGRTGPQGLASIAEGSAAQHVAARLPGAFVVKAFNIVGARLMVDPQFPEGKPDMFVCGDDAEAKALVASLCDEIGYPAFDIGGLAQAPLLESLAMLWISLATSGRARGHAFKLLRPPA